jgi:hypothetical protein
VAGAAASHGRAFRSNHACCWCGSVHRREWTETIRTDVACNDQEIATLDVRQKPVLITKGNNTHVVNVSR